jgi:hypothetical protein
VKTYPFFRLMEGMVFFAQDVLAMHKSEEEWEGTPVLEHS